MKKKIFLLFSGFVLVFSSCGKRSEEITVTPYDDVQVILRYAYHTIDVQRDSLKWMMEDVCHYPLVDSFEIPMEEGEINFDYGITYKAYDNLSNNDGWWTFYINNGLVCASMYEHEGNSEQWKEIIRAWNFGLWVDHYSNKEGSSWYSELSDTAYWDKVVLYLYDEAEEVMEEREVSFTYMNNFINNYSENKDLIGSLTLENDGYALECEFSVTHSSQKNESPYWSVSVGLIQQKHLSLQR